MKILAIETSCDETGIAVVEGTKTDRGFTFTTLHAALLSQAALHAEYGGVYPNLAKREHEKNLPILYREFADYKVDAVAVTQGPGLEPALWQGIEYAKRAAREREVPLIPINHMEGHLISSLAQPETPPEHTNKLEYVSMSLKNVKLPVLGLLISGGHTEFVLMKEWFDYKIVGQTLDDAVGECFDKVARMLGFAYPGGPEISKHAAAARMQNLVSTIKLPRPMLQSGNCDVSFSGLKTAALYALRDAGGVQKLSADQVTAFAREFEETVADVFAAKTKRALTETDAKTFVIGGGVAANTYIREKLQQLIEAEFPNVELRLPQLSLTGDNAIMIAQAALVRSLSGKSVEADETLRAVGNLSISIHI